ncbi:MAG TPA: DinB family protein, partial [Gemmatimonadales bacterium]|nr:DinB family protein [Gemmatimonadales bacterium]
MTQQIGRPEPTEYAAYYGRYISLVPEGEIAAILEQQRESIVALLKSLSEAQGDYRYAPGKWTIKEVVGHVADTERVFGYRAAHFSRSDPAPLPSMEQEVWSAGAESSRRTLASLTDELGAVRDSTVALVRSLSPAQATRRGIASNNEVTARAMVYLC